MIEATLTKRFGVREVLSAARISVSAGTVHALVGENGAGKSTLVKIIAGVLHADAGTLAIGGTTVDVARWDRIRARAAGIGIVQQHGASAGTLSVVENAVLGVEGGPILGLAATAEALKKLGDQVGLPIDPWAEAGELSVGAAQRAEIVAALHLGAKLLILDEPTAVLAPVEVDGLLATLRKLAATGTTIVIVTHKLDEVRAVADDVTVLRAGATVATFDLREARDGSHVDVAAIARAMVGADLPAPAQVAEPAADAKVVLAAKRVSIGGLHDASLEVRAGEIVGVAGVDGNGQRELALAIVGLISGMRGTIQLGGRDVTRSSPAARLSAGLAHIPEDRHHGGLLLDATIADNLALGRADITGRWRIDRERVQSNARDRIAELDVRPADPHAIVRALSGGNQQKVVVGRELSRPALTAVVASQPTRGVDLGAVARIHDQLRAAALRGAGVLVISADLDELLALCHRVVVLLRGKIVGERAGAALRSADARAALGTLMTGATDVEVRA
ncbi:MAG: ATP-binding cassette domain-containing protein [Deltaproteobacteria bacterium]|nr:ATP-binding cassette domain-containing protein [Deltaproteobacteria bacterium]